MAETVTTFRSDLSPTADGRVDPGGYDVAAVDNHVTGSDGPSSDVGGRTSPPPVPPLHQRSGSSGSASVSSCSSHETVVSVGVRQPPPPPPRESAKSSPTEFDRKPEPETVVGRNGGGPSTETGDEVFSSSEMTVMSPLVNRWRRRQLQAAAENNSTSGPFPGWSSSKPTAGFRSDANGGSPTKVGSTHGYSSDTETFLRTLNSRRLTTSGQPVTVSGCSSGQSPSAEYPSWQRDWVSNLHRTAAPSSAVKQLEVSRM